MCNAFEKNNVSVELVLPEPNVTILNVPSVIKNKFGVEMKFNIIFYKKISKYRIIEKYFGIRSVEKIISESDANYVFTRIPKFIGSILKYKRKLIFESHNSKLHNKYSIIDWFWKNKILNQIKDNNFTLFISISQNLTNFWNELGIPKQKQLALHDGFSADLFNNVKDKISSRKELNIAINEKVVMYIGSLYPDREIDNILIAAQATPNLNYYIIGGPNEYEVFYRNMAKKMELSNVNFLGYISHNEVPRYLSAADYLLGLWSRKVPTINYCSPLKVFEYMASGNLIIAHNFPTIQEVLTEGETAFFVDPDDKNDLAKVLKRVLEIDTSKISRNSKKNVYKEYTWEKRAKTIIKSLNKNE